MPGLRKSRGKYPWEVSGNIEADGWCCDSPTVTGSALFSVWETLPNSCSLGFLLQNTLQTLFFRDLFSVFMSVKIIDSIHMQACHPAIPNIVFIVWTICFVIWFLQIRFCRFDCSFTLAMPYFPHFICCCCFTNYYQILLSPPHFHSKAPFYFYNHDGV